jgi:hypothetical protein
MASSQEAAPVSTTTGATDTMDRAASPSESLIEAEDVWEDGPNLSGRG